MGQKMLSMYAEAEKIGALGAKVKLAMLTKTSSQQAGTLPDTPDVLAVFETAMKQIRQEFAK